MKQTDFRFLTAVQRVCTLTIIEKLPLYFLILIGIGLMTGCHRERDIYDLAEETLLICCLTADKSSLNLQETTTITAEVYYSGDPTELLPKWTATKGEIHNNCKALMDVKPRRKHKDTDGRVRMTATYLAPAQIDKEANTDKITFEVGNRGIIVSSAIIVKIINPVTMSDSGDSTSTPEEATPKPEEEENDTAEDEAATKPEEND